MASLVVVGANGLLGQNLIKRFRKKHQIFAASVEEQPFFPADHVYSYTQLDITNRVAVIDFLQTIKPDIVVNAAAFTNVDACEEQPEQCWSVNVRGVEYLVDASRSFNPIFIHVSTDYVFDGENGPYSEEDEPNPRGNYARSKLAAEHVVENSNLEYIIARTQVLFGVANGVRHNFVTWVIEQLTNNKKIRIVDDQIGTPTYAPDFCEAIDRLLEREAFGLFHVSGAEIISRYDFAVKIAQVFELDASLIERITSKELKQKAPRPMNSAFKVYKLINYSGWEPHSLDEALKLMKKELAVVDG
ncbi:dTDP-4-dehydrorhamnose reductase [Calditrichota bacterium GD2]